MDRNKLLFPNGNPRNGAPDAFANGCETIIFEGAERRVGRDPRAMSVAELNAVGHFGPVLRAIRQNCIDCQGGAEAEVRRCALVWCPMWPYRMAANPFHRVTLSDEQREERRQRLEAARTRKAANP